MSYWIWVVEWKNKYSDRYREEFNTKEDAQNFVRYNEWEGGEHPVVKEIEIYKEE